MLGSWRTIDIACSAIFPAMRILRVRRGPRRQKGLNASTSGQWTIDYGQLYLNIGRITGQDAWFGKSRDNEVDHGIGKQT